MQSGRLYAPPMSGIGDLIGDIFGSGGSSSDGGGTLSGGQDFEPQNGSDGGVQSILTGTTVHGSPGAVAYRPGNWDYKHAEYVIAQDDTPYGVALRYLGSGNRWLTDIRPLQTEADGSQSPYGNGQYLNRYTSILDLEDLPGGKHPKSGTAWRQGAVLKMPKEAVDKAIELYGDDSVAKSATTGGAPGSKPGATGAPPFELKRHLPVVLGAVALGLVGIVALSKRSARRTSNPRRSRRRRRRR